MNEEEEFWEEPEEESEQSFVDLDAGGDDELFEDDYGSDGQYNQDY